MPVDYQVQELRFGRVPGLEEASDYAFVFNGDKLLGYHSGVGE